MVGTASQASEPDIIKVFSLHPRWKLMLAGEDVESAFPVIDAAIAEIKGDRPSVGEVMRAVYRSYREKRREDAERLYLIPAGYDTYRDFLTNGRGQLSKTSFDALHKVVQKHELSLELLIAGFDHANIGQIFSVESNETRGIPRRHDLGYYAIGSGSPNADYILQYREYGPKKHIREAFYYAIEAKFYGEDSPTVGYRTDTYVWFVDDNGDLQEKRIAEKTVDKETEKISRALSPNDLKEEHYSILNTLDELKGLPLCPLPEKMQKAKDRREQKNA